MQRLAAVVFAMALAAGACKSKPTESEPAEPVAKGSAAGSGSAGSGAGSGSAAAPAGSPATTTALIQQWGAANLRIAAENLRMTPLDVKVPGIELYWLADNRPEAEAEAESRLVGVVGGVTGKIVEDRELMLAVIAGKPAPKALAKIALAAALRDGEVLDKADGPEQKKAKVTAPAVTGNALSFWVYTSEVPRSLEHGTLDLTTGKLEMAPPAMPVAQLIAQASASLEGPTIRRHAAAADVLAEHCKEPRALQALQHALQSNPRVKSRVAVTEQMHHCGTPAVDALLTAMEQDKASVVRQGAAMALGRIGDARARAALAKASRGDDANLAYAAKTALGKLK